jgi:hypothetical protein
MIDHKSAGSVRDMEPINAPKVFDGGLVPPSADHVRSGSRTHPSQIMRLCTAAPTQLSSFAQACPSTNQPLHLQIDFTANTRHADDVPGSAL